MSYAPSYDHSKNKITVELDLPNYATKFDLENAKDVIHHNLIHHNLIKDMIELS